MAEAANNPTDSQTPPQEPAAPATMVTDKPAEQPPVADPKPADQPTDPKPNEPDAKPAEPAKPEGAPEKYEFKAPEGKEYDSQLVESFSEAAKDANLTQDAAQKLLEKMSPALAARQAEQVQAIQQEWVESSKADKEFGGEKLQENLAVTRKALEAFDPIPQGQTTTALRTLLEETGLGNHPEVIRFMYRAGKAISEDKFVAGHPSNTGEVDAAKVLYDNTTKKE